MTFANRLLIRWGGGYTYREDGGSVVDNGAREAFLSLADVRSVDEMDRIADATIARFAAEQVAYRLAVEPVAGKVPLLDYGIGDTVTLPAISGTHTTARVTGMLVTEDEEGNPLYAPEVGAQLLEAGERADRALARMAPGTLGGRSESATPVIGRSAFVAAATPPDTGRTFMLAFAHTFDPTTPYQTGITTEIFDTVDDSGGDLTLDGLGRVLVGSDGVYRTLAWAALQPATASTGSASTNLLRIEYNAGTDTARSGTFEFNMSCLFISNAASLHAGDLIGVTLNNRSGAVRSSLSTPGILVERVDA